MSDITFDPFSPEIAPNAVQAYADLARACPAHVYHGRFDFVIANDPDTITNSILKDASTWTVEKGAFPTDMPPEMRTFMSRDDDTHTKVRYVVQRGFGPSELHRIGGEIDRIADELIAQLLAMPEGNGDFYELFAMPLPSRLMCVMLGAPEKDYPMYKKWADKHFFATFNDPTLTDAERMASSYEIAGALFSLIAERRKLLAEKGLEPSLDLLGKELPNDFLSRFMSDKVNGEYLPDNEILALMMGFILGGNETTMMLINNLLWRLLQKPELWEHLKANPNLVEAAIEESLRLDPPVLGMLRAARHDTELSGIPVPEGTKVMYNIVAVNRDPSRWENPDEFRLDRPLSELRKHAAFSGGSHFCLGAPVARMEVKMVMQKLINRMPNLRLVGEPQRAPGFNIWGRSYLPLAWS